MKTFHNVLVAFPCLHAARLQTLWGGGLCFFFLLHLPLDKSGNALADKMPTAGTPLSAGFANGDGWALLEESNLNLGWLFSVYVYNCIPASVHALHNIYQHSEAYGSVNMYSRIQEIIINSSFPTACLYPYACVVRLPWAECAQVKRTRACLSRMCTCACMLCSLFIYRWYRGHNASDQEVIPPGNPSRRSTRCKTAGCSPQRDTPPTQPSNNQLKTDG